MTRTDCAEIIRDRIHQWQESHPRAWYDLPDDLESQHFEIATPRTTRAYLLHLFNMMNNQIGMHYELGIDIVVEFDRDNCKFGVGFFERKTGRRITLIGELLDAAFDAGFDLAEEEVKTKWATQSIDLVLFKPLDRLAIPRLGLGP